MISPNGWLLLILIRISIPGIPIHRSAMEPGSRKRIISSNLPAGEGVRLKGDPNLSIRPIKNRHLKNRHHRNRCHRGSRRKSNHHNNSRSNNRSNNHSSNNHPGREGGSRVHPMLPSREGNLTSHSRPTRVSQASNRIAREANVRRTATTAATTTGVIIAMTVSGNPGEWISTISRD